jgi:hypothetical protein
MKKLPKEFEESGYTYKQIEQIDSFYIYKRTKPVKLNKLKTITHTEYEVILPLVKKEFEVNGYKYEAGEYYPGSSVWGTYGWTCISLARARIRVALEKGKLDGWRKNREEKKKI